MPRASVETFLDVYSNPGLSWTHLETLRDRTRLPVVLKGILHPDDARRAFGLGVDAIVVSNHGGRQVDNAIASLDALVDIRKALGPDPTLLLDSGIRTGADVFTALALGANAVLLGRPHLYGLAIAGQRGVEEVIANVVAELDLTMALTGVRDIASITADPRTRESNPDIPLPLTSHQEDRMKHILIVGGGYAGLYAAWTLERQLRREEARVTIVDPRPYMTYQPFLPEVAAGGVEARHAVVSLRRHLRRTRIVAGWVTGCPMPTGSSRSRSPTAPFATRPTTSSWSPRAR